LSITTQSNGGIKGRVTELLSGETLKAKVFRGGAWLGTGSVLEQTARFARNMILARILAPEAFGTMAIVLSAGSVIDTLTEIGVKEAVIQNPRGEEPNYLDAAWWLALGRGVSLYLLMFFLAPSIAKFYGNPDLASLLRVTLLGIVFTSLFSPGIYPALKQMKFHRWAAITHGGGVFGVIVTVALSFYIRNVWALVIGYAAEGLARCVFSYLICPHLPSFKIDRGAIHELTHFSRGMFGLSFLNLVFARTDIFVLAKLYPAEKLGLYAMAIYLAQTPTNFLMNMLGQTLLPTFSNIQDNKERVNRILLQVTSIIVLLGVPAVTFIYFCGHSLLTLAYGQRYGAVSNALFVTACVALLNLVNGQITTVFYADGQPQLHRRSVAIMAILMIILIYPSAKYLGLVGGQIACLLSLTVGYLFQVLRLQHLTGIAIGRYIRPFTTALLISLVAAALCMIARLFSISMVPLVNILFGLGGCLISYMLAYRYFLPRAGKLA
jgi:lipopolysaccharide exporter